MNAKKTIASVVEAKASVTVWGWPVVLHNWKRELTKVVKDNAGPNPFDQDDLLNRPQEEITVQDVTNNIAKIWTEAPDGFKRDLFTAVIHTFCDTADVQELMRFSRAYIRKILSELPCVAPADRHHITGHEIQVRVSEIADLVEQDYYRLMGDANKYPNG